MKSIIFLILLSLGFLSCRKEQDVPSFTDKWWRSAVDQNYFVRFNSDKSYTREFRFVGVYPVSIPAPTNQSLIIKGNWKLSNDRIIFETVIQNNDSMVFLNNGSDPSLPGFPMGYFYSYVPGDTAQRISNILGRWNSSDTSLVDSLRIRNLLPYNDSLVKITSPVIWIIEKITADTFDLIISSRQTKFVFERDKI